MAQEQLIRAIGRIEQALSRIEQGSVAPPERPNDAEVSSRHQQLKTVTKAAISDIDDILAAAAN